MNGKGIVGKMQAVCIIYLIVLGMVSGIISYQVSLNEDEVYDLDASNDALLESEDRGTRSNGDIDYIIIVDSEARDSMKSRTRPCLIITQCRVGLQVSTIPTGTSVIYLLTGP